MAYIILAMVGRRLTYKELTAKQSSLFLG
jgi:hypothetical protein